MLTVAIGVVVTSQSRTCPYYYLSSTAGSEKAKKRKKVAVLALKHDSMMYKNVFSFVIVIVEVGITELQDRYLP